MNLNYFLLFLFSYIYLAYGKDIEIDTVVHLGDNFVKSLAGHVDKIKNINWSEFFFGLLTDEKYKDNNPSVVDNKPNINYMAVLEDLIKFLKNPTNDQYLTDFLKLIRGTSIDFGKIRDITALLSILSGQKPHFRAQEDSQESEDESNIDNVLKVSGEGRTFELIQHLVKKGISDLKHRRIFLNKQLLLGTDALNINHFVDHYLEKITSYWDHITKIKNKIQTDFDEEMILLDMVEASNSILYDEQKRMVDVVIQNSNGTITDNDMGTLVESMKRGNIDYKKCEMRYLCLNKEICRGFPGYFDYLADLIMEVLKLSDKKLSILTKIAIKHVKNKAVFFKSFVSKKDGESIANKLERMPSLEYFITRESYSIARSVITQRNKLLKSDNKGLKQKTIAIRIMMDIIDKAFEIEGEEVISIMFETTTSAIHSWAADKRKDIDTIVSNFINKFFVICESNWNNEVKRDIQILVQVILRGTSINSVSNSKLAVIGSKYLKKPSSFII